MDKTELRTLLFNKRLMITCRETKDAQIKNHVKKLVFQKDRNQIFTYISMGTEVNTKNIIQELLPTTQIYVPYTEIKKPFLQSIMRLMPLFSAENLQVDKLGNLVNQLANTLHKPNDYYIGTVDLVLVPLLGFNRQLYRIGYGGGFYDRYLLNNCALKVGLAYDEQETDFLQENHDIALDVIITPTRVIEREKN